MEYFFSYASFIKSLYSEEEVLDILSIFTRYIYDDNAPVLRELRARHKRIAHVLDIQRGMKNASL